MQTFSVTPRERDTVLAALRYYQFYRMQGHPFDPRQDHLIDAIAAHSGEALDLVEIDDLCAGLKTAERRQDGRQDSRLDSRA